LSHNSSPASVIYFYSFVCPDCR